MRRLILAMFMAAGFIITGINSFAETEQLRNQIDPEDRVNDESTFLTIKDEYGNEHLIKTFALVRFSEDGMEFEMGEPVLPDKTETVIPGDSAILDRGINLY